MRIRLSNALEGREERTRRIHQRQGTANPLFWNILPISYLFPIFCGRTTPSICVSATESIFWLLRRKNSRRLILTIEPGVDVVPDCYQMKNPCCRPASGAHRRMVGHPAFVVAQRDVHEDMAEGGLEADH
jgi:hypothetical protein